MSAGKDLLWIFYFEDGTSRQFKGNWSKVLGCALACAARNQTRITRYE